MNLNDIRVWDKISKKYHKLLIVNYIQHYVSLDTGKLRAINRDFTDVTFEPRLGVDKNGYPVYDGDIVRSSYEYAQPKVSQVFYEEGNSYISGEDIATGDDMLLSDFFEKLEVIGNIHTNPELLKGE